jgi:hypothetical protein
MIGTHLFQMWNMFSPPPRESSFYILEGTLDDGRKVNVLAGQVRESQERERERKREAVLNFYRHCTTGKDGLGMVSSPFTALRPW